MEREPIVLAQLDFMIACNKQALDHCVQTICNAKRTTPERARVLGSTYVHYLYEGRSLMRKRENIFAKLHNTQQNDEDDNHVFEEGIALLDATQGDYHTVKDLLKRHGDYVKRARSKSLSRTELRTRGTRITQIADAMPEKGRPFTPPSPTWLDRRFNPDTLDNHG